MFTPPTLADLCVRCIGETTPRYELLTRALPLDTLQDLLMRWSWRALMINHKFARRWLWPYWKLLDKRASRATGKWWRPIGFSIDVEPEFIESDQPMRNGRTWRHFALNSPRCIDWLRALSEEEIHRVECEHLNRHNYTANDPGAIHTEFHCTVCLADITEDQYFWARCEEGAHSWSRTVYTDERPDTAICIVCNVQEHETEANARLLQTSE